MTATTTTSIRQEDFGTRGHHLIALATLTQLDMEEEQQQQPLESNAHTLCDPNWMDDTEWERIIEFCLSYETRNDPECESRMQTTSFESVAFPAQGESRPDAAAGDADACAASVPVDERNVYTVPNHDDNDGDAVKLLFDDSCPCCNWKTDAQSPKYFNQSVTNVDVLPSQSGQISTPTLANVITRRVKRRQLQEELDAVDSDPKKKLVDIVSYAVRESDNQEYVRVRYEIWERLEDVKYNHDMPANDFDKKMHIAKKGNWFLNLR